MRKLRKFIKVRRFARNEQGGTLAELAILVPFLILMVAAVTEVGRLFQTYTALSKSTRTAARYLTTVTYTDDHIKFTKNMALCGKTDCTGVDPIVSGLKLANIDVVPQYKDGDVGGGNPVMVTVVIQNFTFSPIFNLAGMLGAQRFATLPVRPASTMYYWQVDAAEAEE